MKTKPYPQTEEKPMMVNEPAVAYQRTPPESYRKSQMFDYPKSEMDNMDEEWLRPFTMEELTRRMDEVEADDEADNLLTSEEVFAEMERKYPLKDSIDERMEMIRKKYR